MKFKYVGPHTAVDVPSLGLVNVERGQEIEATGPIAESMAEQDTWQRTDKPKSKES